jgi:hypothetical protein
VLVDVTTVAVAIGDHERAEGLANFTRELAATIDNSYLRVRAETDVVRGAATVGDLVHTKQLAALAEREARKITESDDQAKALADLASVFARIAEDGSSSTRITDDLRRCRRLLADALQIGHWSISASALARISPPAGMALADEVLAIRSACR